jgi:hypothetical protein
VQEVQFWLEDAVELSPHLGVRQRTEVEQLADGARCRGGSARRRQSASVVDAEVLLDVAVAVQDAGRVVGLGGGEQSRGHRGERRGVGTERSGWRGRGDRREWGSKALGSEKGTTRWLSVEEGRRGPRVAVTVVAAVDVGVELCDEVGILGSGAVA